MVYQTESYDYWRRYLGRDDLQPGNFGENFTITGLADDEVCIGDRYRIGEAEFEVTQPRVTCFRVGMRLGEPEMPNLLVAHHRPGFYFRVITEGRVRAGDAIVRTRRGRHELSVADIDALLYLPDRDVGPAPQGRRRACAEPRLAAVVHRPAGRARKLHRRNGTADRRRTGVERISAHCAWPATHRESRAIMSIRFEADDGAPLPIPRPGQYLTLRLPDAGDPGAVAQLLTVRRSGGEYRISVKREDHGAVSRWLHNNIRAGSVIDVAAPRGDFYLSDGVGPVVLLSAGVGVTPVLAMLHALAEGRSDREIWWLHTTRDARHPRLHAGSQRPDRRAAPRAAARVLHEHRPAGSTAGAIAALGLPRDAAVYMCGPDPFMADMRIALTDAGIDPAHIHTELFGALPPINPGIVDKSTARPHPPAVPQEPGRRCPSPAAGSRSTGPREYAQHPGIRGGLRRADAVLVPERGLPHVRHPADRGNDGLHPASAGAAARRDGADLRRRAGDGVVLDL